MANVQIAITVDKAMAIKAGRSVYGRQVVKLTDADLATFTPEERELLAACPFSSDNQTLELRCQDPRVGYMVSAPPVAEASPEAVRYKLIGLEKNILAEVAANQRKHDEQLAEWVAAIKDAPVDKLYGISEVQGKWWIEVPGYQSHVKKDEVRNHPDLAEKFAEASLAAQEALDKAVTKAAEALAEKEAEERAKAERVERRKAQLAAWVKEHGTENQRKRLRRDLLPENEILAAIREQVFAPVADWPLYEKITDQEIWAAYDVYGDDEPETTYDSWEADELSAEEFDALERMETAIPGASVQVMIHRGRLERSSEEEDECYQVERKSLKVTVILGEIVVGRRFAL